MPGTRPMAYISPAAASPSASWRPPEARTGRPVNPVIATDREQRVRRDGRTGTSARIANSTSEVMAAVTPSSHQPPHSRLIVFVHSTALPAAARNSLYMPPCGGGLVIDWIGDTAGTTSSIDITPPPTST